MHGQVCHKGGPKEATYSSSFLCRCILCSRRGVVAVCSITCASAFASILCEMAYRPFHHVSNIYGPSGAGQHRNPSRAITQHRSEQNRVAVWPLQRDMERLYSHSVFVLLCGGLDLCAYAHVSIYRCGHLFLNAYASIYRCGLLFIIYLEMQMHLFIDAGIYI